jgi:quinolinate synthase
MRFDPVSDLEYKKQITKEINKFKKERNAIILSHNYQRDEIQEIADVHGDSLALAHAAAKTTNDVIVFCGVQFMAESASILNPHKTVLLPVKEAGCPLAEMASAEKIREVRKKHPSAAVCCYINSSAEVKAESDICCTSSNAIEVVRSLEEKEVIFLPDRNLGRYVQKNVPEKEIIIWPGFCITHMRLQEEEILNAKKMYPDAEVVAHPECEPDVLQHADCIASTGGMFSYVKKSSKKKFIIATENGMLFRLRLENPDKEFFLPSEHLICANMKLTTLGWLLHSLQNMEYVVRVPDHLIARARVPLERMFALTK